MNYLAVLDAETFDKLPDETVIGKDSYTKNDESGIFYINMSPDEAEKVAFNLKSKFDGKKADLDRVHGELAEAQKKVKAFERLGKSPEELAEALTKNRPEDVAKLLKEEKDKYDLAIASFEKTVNEAAEKAEKYQQQLLKNAVETHIAKISRADSFDLNDTAPFVLQDFLKAEETDDGKVVVRVYENGNPALVAGQPKTTEQLLSGWKEEKKFLSIFNAPNGGGTGASNRQGSFNSKNNFEGLSGAEKLKAARQVQK